MQSIVVVDISVMAHRQIPMVVEFLQLQYIDKMFDVRCAGPASSGSGRENTVEFPQLQPVSWTWSFHTPVVYNDSCPWSVSSCSSLTLVDQFQLSASTAGIRGRFFRALHTGAGPGVVSTGTRPP